MLHKIKDIYYNIKHGIPNIIKYIPIIWQDRNWDEHYIYSLLYFKFSDMEKYWRSDNVWSANKDKTAHQIMIAKNLCKRLIDDNYTENALKPVEDKYGKLKWHFEPSEIKGYTSMVFDETLEESKARSRAYKHSEYMEKQDINYLFRHIEKYIRGWWD